MNILTVSQVNFYVKSLMDSDKVLSNFYVSGEISNFKGHYQSGHLYFSLKDNKSVIKCIMFSNFSRKLRFKLEDGIKVLLRGNLSVYEPTGQYQIYVEDIQLSGIGELSFAFEQLKDKLSKEGLFDLKHKKSLPKYPNKIGVITSPIGAAIKDIQDTLNRRFPIAKVILYPVLVQGDDAAFQIIKAIEFFNSKGLVDVIIIARGGGSIEDLWAFNNELLAKTIYNSDIPIVSGVGHQTDFTICDFVSDVRAPTPTAAAELCTPDKVQILLDIKTLIERSNLSIELKLHKAKSQINILSEKLYSLSPSTKIDNQKISLDILCDKLVNNLNHKISENANQLHIINSNLKSLNPISVLNRGYSIVQDDFGKIIKCANDVNEFQNIKIFTSSGIIECKVIRKED